MIQGMTGFGSSEKGEFRVEVRSLNHRFLEINIRMPHSLMRHEIPLRNIIKGKFARGRFDVFVNLNAEKMIAGLNVAVAREVHARLDFLRNELAIKEPLDMGELLQMKEFFTTEECAGDPAPLFQAFEEAVSQVMEMRLKEGQMLREDILLHRQNLEKLYKEAQAILPEALSGMRDRFVERLKNLLAETGFDETRLVQEAAILTEKADISEEIARIGGHLEQIAKMMKNGDKIGRELDFVLQELHREANTIGSKIEDLAIINKAIEFKTEIERMRQQAQNLQ